MTNETVSWFVVRIIAVPEHLDPSGMDVAATRGVLGSVLMMLEDGATHLAVATDHVVESFVVGCGDRYAVSPVRRDGFLLLPVDERYCRGPFTALLCEPDRCWVAGWY